MNSSYLLLGSSYMCHNKDSVSPDAVGLSINAHGAAATLRVPLSGDNLLHAVADLPGSRIRRNGDAIQTRYHDKTVGAVRSRIQAAVGESELN